MPAQHPLLGVITELYLREGGPPVMQDDSELHHTRLAWEWTSGQWVMAAGKDNKLWGWVSWYRCNRGTYARLKKREIFDLIEKGNGADVDLTQGPCLYVATSVTTTWAPHGIINRLGHAIWAQNPGVKTAGWHHFYANGDIRFIERTRPQPKQEAKLCQ